MYIYIYIYVICCVITITIITTTTTGSNTIRTTHVYTNTYIYIYIWICCLYSNFVLVPLPPDCCAALANLGLHGVRGPRPWPCCSLDRVPWTRACHGQAMARSCQPSHAWPNVVPLEFARCGYESNHQCIHNLIFSQFSYTCQNATLVRSNR